jgi:hypothetical protein
LNYKRKDTTVFKINRRALLVAPILAAAAFAVVPAAASAAACRVIVHSTAQVGGAPLCKNPPRFAEIQNLRENGDGAGTSPLSTNFGTDGLAVNTKGALRYSFKWGGLPIRNSTPTGYGFLGVKLQSNPESSATECRAATGTIPWVDIQHSSPSAVFNGSTAWTFSIKSTDTGCPEAESGKVTISNVSLLFETVLEGKGEGNGPMVAAGSIAGVYEQPGANCPAGGIKINTSQPGLTTEPATTAVEIDNGTANSNAYICFVAANNYLYPSSAPTWAQTEGTGIWNDN